MHRHAYHRLASFGAAILSFLWLSPLEAQLPQPRLASTGVYTEEQAAAGEQVYRSICSKCHIPSFPFWGPKFQGVWMTGGSLYKLYNFVSTMMPGDAGGTLDPEQYRSAIAYILKINGYPAGTTPLSNVPLDIAYINLDPPPGPTTPPSPPNTPNAPATTPDPH